ncbi:hypothetical protein CP973_28970 [Streptomyces albofaciens JCM 4342]|nr:hypothetical protein CP973_28970 [Streptomyces albofaciens JCM 4342]
MPPRRAGAGIRPAGRRTGGGRAVAVIVVLPGGFPAWLEAEQGACGVLLAGVVLIVDGARPRSVFVGR